MISMKNNVGARYFVPLQSIFGARHERAPNFFSPGGRVPEFAFDTRIIVATFLC